MDSLLATNIYQSSPTQEVISLWSFETLIRYNISDHLWFYLYCFFKPHASKTALCLIKFPRLKQYNINKVVHTLFSLRVRSISSISFSWTSGFRAKKYDAKDNVTAVVSYPARKKMTHWAISSLCDRAINK